MLPGTEHLIDLALAEDAGLGDVTSRAIFSAKQRSRAVMTAGHGLVICGLEVAAHVFTRLDPALSVRLVARDGEGVKKGGVVLRVEGPTISLLTAERTALNFIQRLSGIATQARRFADRVAGTGVRIVDTRKTTPGWRALEKYAVRCGGCHNHRSSLGEHVLIKDNHIAAAGSLAKAVGKARLAAPHTAKIEVEAKTLAEVRAAVRSGAEVILLDNMTPDQVRGAVAVIGGSGDDRGFRGGALRNPARLRPAGGGCDQYRRPHPLRSGRGFEPDLAEEVGRGHSRSASMQILRTDCLVIGAGLAGSAYALRAARSGLRVELLSLEGPLAANSDWAQGGIIYDVSTDPEQLARDIREASDGTANPSAIEQLVREGPAAVKELLLDELEIAFDRDAAGQLDFTREGGHHSRRIIHAKDATGHAILGAVAARVDETPGITRRSGWTAVDLLTLSHNSANTADRYAPLTCFGAYVLDTATGEVSAIVAKKTILATGGLGQIFLHSTNQPGSVGHGVAMAYRVGARLIDLEYVQFHPTVFYRKNAPRFPLTEALRGEGGVLVNARGERFMDKIHPLGSLASRDIVARAVHHELAINGDAGVFLDLSAMSSDFIRDRFPHLYERCLNYGVDLTREPVPVVPAAHFSCGGVHTDLHGRTNVCNLNAIGETGCTGLHGANRLASTSLLECLTSAKFAALADAAEIALGEFRLPDPGPWESPRREADPTLVRQDMLLLQHTMWNYAGIVRSARRLTRARRILLVLREEIQSFYRGCRLTRPLIELRNAVQTSLLVVHAAALNPHSKGCHYVLETDE